ncbi:hypothetical protein [Micromonospora vulcania]|uniref:Transcriptional regulator n=1 Tax=Micromonospora vulcania TaxID=1441873 RepID=A0ABW1H3Y7_9ACTN
MRDKLLGDLTVLQHQIAVDTGARRLQLLRAAGCLSVIVALGLVASGQATMARRWWRTAQRAADESGDLDAPVLVRAWDVVNGCYDGRSPTEVVALSDQVLPLLHGQATSATCGLLAGRAQVLSLAGRHAEAIATVRQLSDLVRGGHIPDGLRLAADLLDGLPVDQHNTLLRSVARQVADLVPEAERRRSVYGEIVERLAA